METHQKACEQIITWNLKLQLAHSRTRPGSIPVICHQGICSMSPMVVSRQDYTVPGTDMIYYDANNNTHGCMVTYGNAHFRMEGENPREHIHKQKLK